ncbi:MAG: hypothetical protein WBG86_02600, partial [Polyangiales bacterium]
FNESILGYLVKTQFRGRVQVLPGTFDHHFVSMAFSRDSRLREPLNRAILESLDSDEWPRILKRY